MCTQADKSKTRMNLAAIKKIDPYAKDIVDTSSHVAFYIFNEERNEWEKTDVEGALFIYNRTAAPFHSIFINNRLNTTAFVEPINKHLELQPQPPFLLYRNERSRIRGFWFYSSEECERISKLVMELVKHYSSPSIENNHNDNALIGGDGQCTRNNNNVNIFKMLSNAQQEYNAQLSNNANTSNCITATVGSHNVHQSVQQLQQVHKPQAPQNLTSGNVLKFFAAAKPRTDIAYTPRILPNTLSVEQLEKQQRNITPGTQSIGRLSEANPVTSTSTPTTTSNIFGLKQHPQQQQHKNDILSQEDKTSKLSRSLLENDYSDFSTTITASGMGNNTVNSYNGGIESDVKTIMCTNNMSSGDFPKAMRSVMSSPNSIPGEEIPIDKIFSNLQLQQPQQRTALLTSLSITKENNKPALMPPTMFDKPLSMASTELEEISVQRLVEQNLKKQEPLNKFQFVQAFNYLIQNDEEFVQKLHDAYLKTLTKFGTYQ